MVQKPTLKTSSLLPPNFFNAKKKNEFGLLSTVIWFGLFSVFPASFLQKGRHNKEDHPGVLRKLTFSVPFNIPGAPLQIIEVTALQGVVVVVFYNYLITLWTWRYLPSLQVP